MAKLFCTCAKSKDAAVALFHVIKILLNSHDIAQINDQIWFQAIPTA